QKRVCCDEYTAVQKVIAAATGAPITVPTYRLDRVRLKLRPAEGQGEPIVVADVTGRVQRSFYTGDPAKLQRRDRPKRFRATFELDLGPIGYELRTVKGLTAGLVPQGQLIAKTFDGVHLEDVASKVGLDFRQDDFRFTTTVSDVHSMMGGGLCWVDYNDDGWPDLFVVNSYSDGDIGEWNKRGGPPTSALFENVHGHFVDV